MERIRRDYMRRKVYMMTLGTEDPNLTWLALRVPKLMFQSTL